MFRDLGQRRKVHPDICPNSAALIVTHITGNV